jgi:hypothetical protein
MTIETKKVYISEDGKEFDTFEDCQKYESKNSIEALESKIVELTQQRELEIALKNRYKANKHGALAVTEANLQREYEYIAKIMKTPVGKLSNTNIHYLKCSFENVGKLRSQKQNQKIFLDDLRNKINERGEQIKNLYEKVVKLKVEKLNS